MQSITISDYRIVKRIKGCQLGGPFLSKLSFSKKDSTEVKKIELNKGGQPYGQEFVLDDDEEIIGMFGSVNGTLVLKQLGFIVWKPPIL